MTRPDLVLRHARTSPTGTDPALRRRVARAPLAGLLLVLTATVLPGAGGGDGVVALGPVTKVALTNDQLANRAEWNARYARKLGQRMNHDFGYGHRQWRCLRRLWKLESSWRVHADNPYSSAYGIPQAMPGKKMSTAGDHWRTNAETQIRWGLRYVRSRYERPCGAMRHKNRTGWY